MSLPFDMTGVTKQFGDKQVLAGATLKLSAGTVTGLLGTNGAGKSTLLKTTGCAHWHSLALAFAEIPYPRMNPGVINIASLQTANAGESCPAVCGLFWPLS